MIARSSRTGTATRGLSATTHACTAMLAAAASLVQAQESTEVRGSIRIEVTGSNIPRTDIESALPIQILTREDIERSGSTTAAELMSKVSANMLGQNDQLSIASFRPPGLSSVNLRGIGSGDTLVLVNGRRVANYAFDGSAVDVNSIPLAAVERVEVLKDGASAIYGTDAVAGVVNFILRRDYRGIEVTGYGSWPEHRGGEQYQAVVSGGFGDLAKDRYNVFVTAVYQKDEPLTAIERAFASTAYRPDEGLVQLPPTPFPANIFFPPRLYNPSFASGCAPPYSLPATGARTPGDACGFDYIAFSMIVPQVERTAVYGRSTLQASADHQVFAELAYSDNRLVIGKAPTSIALFTNPNGDITRYPAGGPFYPTEFAAANGISGNLDLLFNTAPLGRQKNQVDTSAWRAVLGAEGVVVGWDYATALTYTRNDQSDSLRSGWVSLTRLNEAMATGLVNPFGPSGPEGEALLASTQVSDEFHTAKGTTLDFLVKSSRDTVALPGGPLAVAVGAEARRERLSNDYTTLATTGDIAGLPIAVQSVSGSRSAQALFVEASVPFARGFEAQIAGRYDHYGDFGSTWNPKVALRWQPVRSLLLRTSWGTGFRAPPLYDLHTPQEKLTLLFFEDPLRCPVTGADHDCGGPLPAVTGGNPNLQPETSKQVNAGVVWEPVPGSSISVDYWRIAKDDLIGTLAPETIFDNFALYAPTNIVRGPVDPQYPTLAGPITNVIFTNQNLGHLATSGIDVDMRWRGPGTGIGRFGVALNGTYITQWKLQPDGYTYESAVGRNAVSVPGPFPRWKHYASLDWQYGAWGATLAETFQSGYEDTNNPQRSKPLPPRRVSSYELWDLQARYSGLRHTRIVLGVRNLFDRAPPFTNQPFTYQVGYDPNYAEPRGRSYYASISFTFK